MPIPKHSTQRPYEILHRFLLLREAPFAFTRRSGDPTLAHALVHQLIETKNVRIGSTRLSVQSQYACARTRTFCRLRCANDNSACAP